MQSLVTRTLTVLFAVQVVAAGFCLLMPQAHAMTQTEITSAAALESEALCAKKDVSNSHLPASDEADDCFHCEKPDLATAPSFETPPIAASALLLVVATVVADSDSIEVVPWSRRHDPGDSAGDRALLFHLIPRIRV